MCGSNVNWLFVLAHGRLSLAEILCYIEARGLDKRLLRYSDRSALFSIKDFDAKAAALKLGGIFKIGKAPLIVKREEALKWENLQRLLDSVELYEALEEKIGWGVSFYSDRHIFTLEYRRRFLGYFEDRLRRDGVKKARLISFKKSSEDELLTYQIVRRSLLTRGLEIMVAEVGEYLALARTVGVSDILGFRERDFERPFQNPLITIPPSLARVLVNLTGLRHNQTILDPFCGIGTILGEALMMGLDVRGLDIDGRRVSECIENLKWLIKKYRLRTDDPAKKIIVGDATCLSKLFKEDSIDGVASEPILLPPFKHFPSRSNALAMLEKSERIYHKALCEMAKVLKKDGRLAIVVPIVRLRGTDTTTFSLNRAMKDAGLKLKQFPVEGLDQPFHARSSEDQKVLRAVYIMEKI